MNSNYKNDKNESSLDDNNNPTLLKDLKNEIDKLEKEKLELIKVVEELREKEIDLTIANDPDQIKNLEKERDETKKSATDSLTICSKMAEELIVLRDKLDKFYHNSNK